MCAIVVGWLIVIDFHSYLAQNDAVKFCMTVPKYTLCHFAFRRKIYEVTENMVFVRVLPSFCWLFLSENFRFLYFQGNNNKKSQFG